MGLFYEGHVPIHEIPPSCPNHISITIELGVRISTYEFGRGTQTFKAEHSLGLGLDGTEHRHSLSWFLLSTQFSQQSWGLHMSSGDVRSWVSAAPDGLLGN